MSENQSSQSEKVFLSSSPHFSFGLSTQKIMACVLIALLPEVVAGTVFFGFKALSTVLISVASCVVFEALFQLITKQKVLIKDLSACVSGVMLAMVVPPTLPWWITVLGALVAMVIAKGLFGGIGSNVFNPALTGRAFLFLSFPAAMGASWIDPKLDAISQATILSQIKAGTFTADSSALWNLFLGNRAGCIGETSALLILISFVFLLVLHIIDWRAPLAMTATVAISSFVSGLISSGTLAGGATETLLALLTGGLLFGAVFMVTDYATTPVTKGGRLVFGFGCGLITFLIRRFGSYPEGVMFSILVMNAIAPFLNNITYRKYGYGKKGNLKVQEKNQK